MQEMNKTELLQTRGGAITGTYINAVIKGIDTLLELGRSLGGSVRRWLTGETCPLP